MKPFAGYKQKYKAQKTDHVGGFSKGVSTYDKLIARNANRSHKKATRQALKNWIKLAEWKN
jgi:hypothetical protein